ncbi:MAG: PAS domain S-box protein [Nitrospiraceae bacterium]|nr:MAG: PAS domain S-box protein [Nitrospiraceae bacterium]
MFKSVRTKILASFFSVFMLLVLTLGWFNYVFTKDYLEKTQKKEMESLVHHLQHVVHDELADRMHILKRLSETRELKEYIEMRSARPFMEKVEGHKNLFPLMRFINEKGVEEIKLINGNPSEKHNISSSRLFKEVLKSPGKIVSGKAEWNPDLKELAIDMGLAISAGEDGASGGSGTKGILVGTVPFSHIADKLSDIKIGTTGFAILTDGDGDVLYHPDKKLIFRNISGEGGKFENILPGANVGFTRADILGAESYVSYAPVKDMGWSLLVVLPYKEFIATPNIARNTTLLICIVALIIGGGVSVVLSGGIIRPLLKLAGAAKEIARGNYKSRLGITSMDEIGAVTDSFNRMAEALEKTTVSRNYVDNILHTMNDALIVLDNKGLIVTVNKAALDLLEYTEEELAGQPVEKIFPGESPFGEREAGTLIKDTVLTNIEAYFNSRSDNNIPVSFSSSTLRDDHGEVRWVVCVAQDASERKWMQESLTASEEYFRSFVESSQDCICNLTVDGKIMNINSSGKAINDADDEEIIGADFTSCVVEKREGLTEAIKRAAAGDNASVQYKTRSKKGSERWWDTRLTPVRDLDGSIRSIMSVARDITENRKTQESLIKTQQMLIGEHEKLNNLLKEMQIAKKEWESTMDCIGDMIILTDRSGVVIKFNRAFAEFTQAPENIVNKDWEKIIDELEMETVTFYSGSIELLHRPSQRWFELNSYPFEDVDIEFSGAVITMHETTEVKNITRKLEDAYTELKSTQTQILQREKMASIGQLAAGVAHEINNPMGFISSNLGTLGKYMNKLTEFVARQGEIIDSLKSPEAAEGIRELKRKLKLDYVLEDIGQLINESLEGADRVKNIVQNLKTFSRVDEAEYKHVDINECIESTLNIVWNELKYNATVVKEYGELPLTKCYPQQLNQVFMNLLVNAAQAIEKQGEIKIKTWNGDGSVNVAISDTGCGIPEDKLSRIFEPFYTTKPVGKGTGLGLSITYDIVKKHNGDITVESETGKGTTFTVRIPVVEGR